MKFYPSLEAFYSANEARRRSPEADYGMRWRDAVNPGDYRVSYVQATGEVYALNNWTGQLEVLGVIPPDPDERRRDGLPLGRTYYRTLDRILEGWVDQMRKPGGLAWVRERLAEAREEMKHELSTGG